MNKIDLGRTITILANVGVLIGIILLVVELDQNRQMMRAQIRSEISGGLTEPLMPVVIDGQIADLIIRAIAAIH